MKTLKRVVDAIGGGIEWYRETEYLFLFTAWIPVAIIALVAIRVT